MYFTEGWLAFEAGKFFNECPYSDDSYATSEWRTGWLDAKKVRRNEK